MSVGGYTFEEVKKLGLRDTEQCREDGLFYVRGTMPVKAVEPVKIDDSVVSVDTNIEVKTETPVVAIPLVTTKATLVNLGKTKKEEVKDVVSE